MSTGCNIWMIFLKLNRFFYGLSRMLQFSQFVWTLSYSVWDVFNNFLLIDATHGSKISSDQKRLFFAGSVYPLSFFANTLFNLNSKFLSLAVYKSLNTKMCTFLKQHLYPLLVQWLKKTFFSVKIYYLKIKWLLQT